MDGRASDTEIAVVALIDIAVFFYFLAPCKKFLGIMVLHRN